MCMLDIKINETRALQSAKSLIRKLLKIRRKLWVKVKLCKMVLGI